MRDVQYGLAWMLFYWAASALLPDIVWWRLVLGFIFLTLGFAVLLDWIRQTSRTPDPRSRWQR